MRTSDAPSLGRLRRTRPVGRWPAETRVATHGARELSRAERVGLSSEAGARTRTGDPFITSEVLYQLSYAGAVGPV